MSDQQPTVARMVHYVAFGTPGGEYAAGAHRAAIVTVANKPGNIVSLLVVNPTGVHFRDDVPQDETTKKPGTWHWPERV